MKILFENWRKFSNEARISTKFGDKEVKPSRGTATEHFFAHKNGKFYTITHKPSGLMIDGMYWMSNPKYDGLSPAKKVKKVIEDLENLNIPGIENSKLENDSLILIRDFFMDNNPYLSLKEGLLTENWKKFVNETTSEATSQNFNKLATAFGAISQSMSDDAEKTAENEEQLEKFKQLADNFEKAGLEDFLERIPDIDKLIDSIDDPEGTAEFIKGLQDMDLTPEEILEKLSQIQVLRDEFDEFKTSQEDSAKEQEQRDIEQDKASKNASREQGFDDVTSQNTE